MRRWRRGTRRGGWARGAACGLALGIAAALPPAPAAAILTGLPSGFVDELVVGGLPFPTAVAFLPDDRLLVALKRGEVRLYERTPAGSFAELGTFVDIRDLVHDNHDRGLLGLAVHPGFPSPAYVYLLYTHDPEGVYPDSLVPGAIPNSTPARVAQLLRVEADPATGYTTAKAEDRVVLLGTNSLREHIGSENDGRNTAFASCMAPKNTSGAPVEDCIPSDENSHTIGTVAFAPDGSLFATSGDASNYGGVDPRALRAQHLDSLAGKILRIDPETGHGLPDNPFYDAASPNRNRSKVWAYGLRNPFRIAIHPQTGEPWIGDVGWSGWEEIDAGKGANFGWPCYEGGAATPPEGGVTTSRRQPGYETSAATAADCAALYAQGLGAVKAPVFAYDHSDGGASANAGAFYAGSTYPPPYRGALFIADYSRRWIRYLAFDAQGKATVHPFAAESSSTSGPVQILTGPDTNLYWMKYAGSGGELRRIRYEGGGNTPPVVIASATPTIGQAPLAVAFDASDSYDPDTQSLAFEWDFGDGSPTSAERDPEHVYAAAGVYDAVLTATETTAPFASTDASIRITVGNSPPLAAIQAPADGATYRVGDEIAFAATATSGPSPVPASQLAWELRTLHNQHVHYGALASGADPSDPFRSVGSFAVDDHGDDVRLQLCVTVTVVPEGFTDTPVRDLAPELGHVTLATDPLGLHVTYEDEGVELLGPAIVRPVVGSTQTISVRAVQEHRSFVAWADGSTERSRTFTVDPEPLVFTARYENLAPEAVASPAAAGGPAPLTVTLDASLSSDPEGDALQPFWDAGALGTSEEASPSFTFLEPGDYAIALRVTDQLGASDEVVVPVSVGTWGPQTKAQRRCVRTVIRGVAAVVRAQRASALRCLADAAAGRVERLGPLGHFDGCLEADVEGGVARARARLAADEPAACAAEPPELGLGSDRLAGAGAASAEGAALARDLFGDPAAAVAPATEPDAARCQRALLRQASAHQEAVLRLVRRALRATLRGGDGAPPAATDVELTAGVAAALQANAGLARAERAQGRALERRCGAQPDLAALAPGCAAPDAAGLAACAASAARCRACRVAVGTAPGLLLGCDALDDGAPNGSCAAP